MARTPVTAPITGSASARQMSIPALVQNINNANEQTYTDFAAADAALDQRLDALEAGGGSGGLASVAHDTSLTGAGTAASPLGVARPVPAGTEGQVVGYGAGGALTPLTLSGGGTIPSDVPRTQSNPAAAYNPAAPWVNSVMMRYGSTDLPMPVGHTSMLDLRAFGAVTLQDPRIDTISPPELTTAQLNANAAAWVSAENWAFENGGFIQFPGGMFDVPDTLFYRAGVGVGGVGEHHTIIRQRNIATALGQTYADVLMPHATLGAGYNTFRNLVIHGGWTSRKEYEGAGGGVWEYDLATSEQKGLGVGTLGSSVGTLGNGPGPAQLWPNGGTDSQNRVEGVLITRVKGYGLHAVGRGEMRVDGLWTALCAKHGILSDMADNWYSNISAAVSGDSAIKFLSGASNARGSDIKGWFCGLYMSSEVVGAGFEIADEGAKNMIFVNLTTQDSWGPGIVARANLGVSLHGHIDEAGGGRLGSLGRTTRTMPRCDIRLPGAFRRSKLDFTRSGGARQGAGGFPYLIDMRGAGIEHSEIIMRGPVAETVAGVTQTLDTATGTITIGSETWNKSGGVLTSGNYVTAKRHNTVTFNKKLVHGKRTLAELADTTHGVNDADYGPDECVTEFGAPAFRKSTEIGGGWEVQPITVTQAQWNAMSTAVRARGNFDVLA